MSVHVYIETKDYQFPIDTDVQKAADGFELLGFTPKYWSRVNLDKLLLGYRNEPVVGSLGGMAQFFNALDCHPRPIDYPSSVLSAGWVRRDMHVWNLRNVVDEFRRTGTPVFVKPVDTKLFDGIPISDESHLNFFNGIEDVRVHVSPIIDIVSEWRAYVHNSKLVMCSNYSGDFEVGPDYDYIKRMIGCYSHYETTAAYTIDVAVLEDGSNDLIEFNDFWAIGSYGLDSIKYAEMLRDRFTQIVGPILLGDRPLC